MSFKRSLSHPSGIIICTYCGMSCNTSRISRVW